MELYTSLTRLKMAMNNGALPPMTRLTPAATAVVDEALCPGMGALDEDAEKGLRCPVRGCGVYRHRLGMHMDSAHVDIGGSRELRRLLSIPQTASLVSHALRDKLRVVSQKGLAVIEEKRARGEIGPYPFLLMSREEVLRRQARSHKSSASTRNTVGAKNLRDSCVAQLSNKLLDLAHEVGRSPVVLDADRILGHATRRAIESAFGSWNAAKAYVGLSIQPRGRRKGDNYKYKTQMDVAECFRAYYAKHGTLPSAGRMRYVWPLLPSDKTVLRHFGTDSWAEAMRQIAALLGIEGGRYGLPKQERVA